MLYKRAITIINGIPLKRLSILYILIAKHTTYETYVDLEWNKYRLLLLLYVQTITSRLKFSDCLLKWADIKYHHHFNANSIPANLCNRIFSCILNSLQNQYFYAHVRCVIVVCGVQCACELCAIKNQSSLAPASCSSFDSKQNKNHHRRDVLVEWTKSGTERFKRRSN